MDETILQYFITQGPWAVLFVFLLVYVMKKNAERETRLHNTLDAFANKYDIVIKKLDKIENRLPKE
ncbi:BhlA/UviB family holin-like peptide [Gracilibacillus saliphilus]|uniref:BhlA/UviB family holin-like peptide n=1 Tax=Gracilibacillus saliphilus TaxID=543890 RepID=UPI0013CFA232|nr:BhlA/UviB family holin-like peptide [Gracilibacillus saliphilus]